MGLGRPSVTRGTINPLTSSIFYDVAEHVFSGRKIVEILKKNPNKDPGKYDEEDIPHMRKVVSYCKRHLAQEGKAKQDPNSKSAKSLKNWGHDPQKTEDTGQHEVER